MQGSKIVPATPPVARRSKPDDLHVLNDDGTATNVGRGQGRPPRKDYENFSRKGDRTSIGGSNPPAKVHDSLPTFCVFSQVTFIVVTIVVVVIVTLVFSLYYTFFVLTYFSSPLEEEGVYASQGGVSYISPPLSCLTTHKRRIVPPTSRPNYCYNNKLL